MDRFPEIHQKIMDSKDIGLGRYGLFLRVLNEFARWNDHVTFESGAKLEFQNNGDEMNVILPPNPNKADLFEIAKKISVNTERDEKIKIGERWSKIGRFLLENADSATVIFKKKIDDPTQVPAHTIKGIKYIPTFTDEYCQEIISIGNVLLDLAEQLGVARTKAKLTGEENREVSRILLGKSSIAKSGKDETITSENTTHTRKVLPIILSRLAGANVRNSKHIELTNRFSTKFEGRSLGELQRPEKEVLRAILGRGKEFLRNNLTVRAIGLDNDELMSNYLKIDEYKGRIASASTESEKDDIKLEFIKNLHEVIHHHMPYEENLEYRSFSVKGILDRNMTQCQGYSLIAETYCEVLDIKYIAMSVPKHATGIVNIGDNFYISDLGYDFGIVDVSDFLSEKDKKSIIDNVVGETYSLENTMWIKHFYSHLNNYQDKGDITLSIGLTDPILAANLAFVGAIYQKESEYDLAQLCYRYTIALSPDDPMGYDFLYTLYHQLGSDNKYEDYLLKAIDLDPWNLEPLLCLAHFQERVGDHRNSQITLLNILSKDSEYAEAYCDLGDLHFKLRQYGMSKKYYENFLFKVGSNADLQVRLQEDEYFRKIVEYSRTRIIECDNFLQKT